MPLLTDKSIDAAARAAWNLDGNATSLNDYVRAFKAGFKHCQDKAIKQQMTPATSPDKQLTCRICGKQGPQQEMIDHLWRICKATT